MLGKITVNKELITKMLPVISYCDVNELNNALFIQKEIRVSMLRLDEIHPVISGNKLFKLHYFLEAAFKANHQAVITFGGAYSNHLVATAYACKLAGLRSVGIVRGERPTHLSHTLQDCLDHDMHLLFISRQDYERRDDHSFISSLQDKHGKCTIIPEGGYHPLGAKGASLIMNLLKENEYTHVCTAVGSATTLAGLLLNTRQDQHVVGIPVLKGMHDMGERISFLTGTRSPYNNMQILDDYHFGGYAKTNDILIRFMNEFWQHYNIALDFVYTAKMMYAVIDKIKADHFPAGSRIICLHTGGLQGNS